MSRCSPQQRTKQRRHQGTQTAENADNNKRAANQAREQQTKQESKLRARSTSAMKQQRQTIRLENVIETVTKELEHVSIEDLPELDPVSDTSATSACSTTGFGLPENQSSSNFDTLEGDIVEHTEEKTALGEDSDRKRRRKVHFGTISFRLFPMIPGDHPDAQGVPVRRCCGPIVICLLLFMLSACTHTHTLPCFLLPHCNEQLTMAWDAVKQVQQSIDAYETQRTERRHDDELRLGWLERRRILRRLGATEEELSEAAECAHKVRKQRQQTNSWRSKKMAELPRAIRRSLGRTFHPKRSPQNLH